MTEPIRATNTIYQNVNIALEGDKKISESELEQIVAAVRARGGVAPRELAQARILAQNLAQVMLEHGMSGTYNNARAKYAAAVAESDAARATYNPIKIAAAEAKKLAAALVVAAAESEVRAMARDNQATTDKIETSVRTAYGNQWWIQSFVLSLVYGGNVKLPEQDAGLDAVGRVID
jgi:hypothetical protein